MTNLSESLDEERLAASNRDGELELVAERGREHKVGHVLHRQRARIQSRHLVHAAVR